MKVLREVRRVNVPMLEAQTRVVCKCQFGKFARVERSKARFKEKNIGDRVVHVSCNRCRSEMTGTNVFENRSVTMGKERELLSALSSEKLEKSRVKSYSEYSVGDINLFLHRTS